MTVPDDKPQPEDTAPSEEPAPSQELFVEQPILPDGFTPIPDSSTEPRARRRRAHRGFVPLRSSERAALLEDLARRAFPSIEFFLFALLCGTILGAAYILDAPALLLLGILLAPMLTPWVGLTLAAMTGSWRFFFQTLLSLTIAGAILVLTGGLAGLVGRLWGSLPLFYASKVYTLFWWPDWLVTALGAAILIMSLVRSEKNLILPNILLAYGLFLPLSAAGVGLGQGNSSMWANGAQVFLVHLALATLTGGIILAIMHFRPARTAGCILPVLIGIASLAALVFFTGLPTELAALLRHALTTTRYQTQTPTATLRPSATATLPFTPTDTFTPEPSITPSLTLTPQPTPSYAMINAAYGGGAKVRSEPGTGSEVTVLINGIIVEVLPEIQSVDGDAWVHIRTADGIEGWVLQSVLSAPSVSPSPVPTNTATP